MKRQREEDSPIANKRAKEGKLFTEQRSDLDYYNDGFGVKSKLKEYIQQDTAQICVYFDVLGIGKTATVMHAARETNVLRIDCSLGFRQFVAAEEVLKFMNNIPRSQNQILEAVQNYCADMLVQLLQNQTIEPKQKYIDSSHAQYKYENTNEDKLPQLHKILNNMLCVSGSSKILLHITHCQEWSEPKFERQSDPNKCDLTNEKYSFMYLLSGLTMLLNRLVEQNPRVRVVMTGTNILLEKQVIGDPLVLSRFAKQVYTTKKMISQAVSDLVLLGMREEYENELDSICEELTGPFSVLSLFLKHVSKDTVYIHDLRDAVTEAKKEFNVDMQVTDQITKILIFLPQLFGGKQCAISLQTRQVVEQGTPESVDCIQFKLVNVPCEWFRLDNVRWILSGDFAYMLPPYPFLRQFLQENSKFLDHQVRASLLRNIVAGQLHKNDITAYQYAIALELTNPYSPLRPELAQPYVLDTPLQLSFLDMFQNGYVYYEPHCVYVQHFGEVRDAPTLCIILVAKTPFDEKRTVKLVIGARSGTLFRTREFKHNKIIFLASWGKTPKESDLLDVDESYYGEKLHKLLDKCQMPFRDLFGDGEVNAKKMVTMDCFKSS